MYYNLICKDDNARIIFCNCGGGHFNTPYYKAGSVKMIFKILFGKPFF